MNEFLFQILFIKSHNRGKNISTSLLSSNMCKIPAVHKISSPLSMLTMKPVLTSIELYMECQIVCPLAAPWNFLTNFYVCRCGMGSTHQLRIAAHFPLLNRTAQKTNWWKIKFLHKNVAQIEMQSGQSGLLKNFYDWILWRIQKRPQKAHRELNAGDSSVSFSVCECVCEAHVRLAELMYEFFYRMFAKKAKNCAVVTSRAPVSSSYWQLSIGGLGCVITIYSYILLLSL